MGLEEHLRARCLDPLDAISRAQQSLDEKRRNRVAALERAQRARDEASRLRGAVTERESTARTIQTQIADLENQLQQIRLRIESRKQELQECVDAQSEVGREVAEQRRLERTDSELAESLVLQIGEIERSLETQNSRLRDARRAALTDYLDSLWRRIEEILASHESTRAAVDARRNLERERHEDSELASLWEAREEWRRILQTAGPSMVVKTARAELEQIEAKLESRFPGALSASGSNRSLSEIEELFVAPRSGDSQHGSWIPLPVPLDVWRSLERGARGNSEVLAMRLIWAFARALPPSNYPGGFFAGELCCGLVVDASPSDLAKIDAVNFSLPTGESVSFILSPLPPEVASVVAQDFDE
jgi:predicted  nucleic acid-binding Zn-ribbon protein